MPSFALVDCNNFYASCERVFNPALEKKALVILSNNDGCIIARSNEAKALGIPMGAPLFQWRDFLKKHSVHIYSSNFALYGDMSQRVMTSLAMLCPEIEIYSVDEAFLNLTDFSPNEVETYALMIRQKIKQWTGIPVSIGIAPTKTLAKMANLIAKKKSPTGVCNLTDENLREAHLTHFPVEDLWGIGKQTAFKLKAMRIKTALALRNSNLKHMRTQFSIAIEKTISELRGISCLPLEHSQAKKQIISSRSFGRSVTTLSDLEEAVGHYTAKACITLRKQKHLAQGIAVFIQSNFFNTKEPYYENTLSCHFIEATSDSRHIIKSALNCLHQIYKPGYRYKKAGVILLNLCSNTIKQYDLLQTQTQEPDLLMKTLDDINHKLGRGTIFIAREGIERTWQAHSDLRSPCYTTRWEDLPKVGD